MANMYPRKNLEVNDQPIPFVGVGKEVLMFSLRASLNWIRNSNASIELQNLAEEVDLRLSKFVDKFYTIKSHLQREHLSGFVEACKHRSDGLYQLMSKLSVIDEEVELIIQYGNNAIEADNLKLIGTGNIFAVFEDDEREPLNVFTIEQNPKCYYHLYVAIIKLMQQANRMQQIDKPCFKAYLGLCEIIISASKIYTEFRSNPELIADQEVESLRRMTSTHILDTSSEYMGLFDSVVKDIVSTRFPKKYIQEMVRAIARNKQFTQSPFGDQDYYFSGRGTSSRIKGGTKRISLVASAYEIDPWLGNPFDSYIGYESHYNKEAPEGYYDPGSKTVTINQNKLKRRAIHITNNATQDRCNYVHRRLARILGSNRCDCTKNQDSGILFALQVTQPKRREVNGYPSVNCADIIGATDNLNQEFQLMCVKAILGPEVAQFWSDVTTAEKEFVHYKRGQYTKYKQTCGQPQGVLGSFDLFALAHHIIMLMVMKATGRENIDSVEFYRILGDDSIVNTVTNDQHELVRSTYEGICQWLNWRIEQSKSHYVTHTDKSALAEFAKVTVLNGEIVTPPPIRILSRIADRRTNYYSFTTVIWMMRRGFQLPGVLDQLITEWYSTDEERSVVNTLIYGGIIPQFRDLVTQKESELLNRAQVALCYLVTKIRGTFVECILGDKAREELLTNTFMIEDAFSSIAGEDTEEILGMIIDSKHKLILAIDKNSIIENALKRILGLENSKLIIPLADLTETEIGAIIMVADILDTLDYQDMTDELAGVIIRLLSELDTLDRYQMRSFHKHVAKEISYFNEVIKLYNKLFQHVEQLEGVDEK